MQPISHYNHPMPASPDNHAEPPELPAAPPTTPGTLPERPQSWPTPLGIVFVILGGLGALIAGSQVVQGAMHLWMGPMFGGQPGIAGQPGMDEMFDVYTEYAPLTIAAGTVQFLLAALLVAGAILLMMRNHRSRPILVLWAVAKLAASPISALVAFLVQRDSMNAVMSNATAPGGGPPPAIATKMGTTVALVMIILALIWMLTPPAFVLVWLSRSKIRAHVATWRRV